MWFRANVFAFALAAGAIAATGVFTGDIGLISLWGIPLGTVVGMNIGYVIRRRRGDEMQWTEAEFEAFQRALTWGFVVAALTLPALLTYDELRGATTDTIAGWVVAAGVVTTFALVIGFGLGRSATDSDGRA